MKNRLNEPTAKAQVPVGDITYLPMQDGWFYYPAVWQDKYTRRIVGWKVGTRMTAQPVIDVFLQAQVRGLRRLLSWAASVNQCRDAAKVRGNAQAESFFS